MSAYLRPHNDEPVATLGVLPEREALAGHIADAIAKCEPPHVFGVHGDWGSGKTSFLCALEQLLRGCCRRIDPKATPSPPPIYKHLSIVWFESWRYQHEPSPVIALLHELCAQLPISDQAGDWLKKLAYAGFRGLINTVKEVTVEPKIAGSSIGSLKLNNPFSSILQAGEQYERDHFLVPLTTEGIREALNRAIKALLGDDERARVLIIIDDLDRCEAAAAYRLLEEIKIYLNIPSCVFLLGINQRHINRALGDSLGLKDNLSEAEKRGAEYLEKLCSVIWKLPVTHPDAIGSLIMQWLRPQQNGVLKDDHPMPKALIELVAQLGSTFDCLPRNSRKLKAFCNSFRYLAAQVALLPGAAGEDLIIALDDADALIIAASLYTFHPELLARLQASRHFFETLLKFSLEGLISDSGDAVVGWMSTHEAFRSIRLPWRNANASRRDWDEYPNPDEGHVFRIQSLLNHAVGATGMVALPAGYTAARTREALYQRLIPYLHLRPL